MGRDKLPTAAIAGAILVGALVLLGMPLGALAISLALLVCPLMMIVMMGGMDHGGVHGGHEKDRDAGHESQLVETAGGRRDSMR